MEHAARFEEVRIQLPEPLDGVDAISAVVGIPEWWPTGARVAVAIAHGADSDLDDPMVEYLHRSLAARKYLTVRFNFPFAEAGRSGEHCDLDVLDRAFRAALSVLGRDPTAAPSHLFLGGMGLGGVAAAQLASARLQIDGVFFVGYPLHLPGDLEQPLADALYRIIPAMLFVQGSDDPHCDLGALRRVLSRAGAPTTLRILDGADHTLVDPSGSDAEHEANRLAVARTVSDWIERILDSAG